MCLFLFEDELASGLRCHMISADAIIARHQKYVHLVSVQQQLGIREANLKL